MSANPLKIPPLYIRFYFDALNFYHRVACKYGIKWIDLEKLLISLVREKIPNAEVEKIFIFTARVNDIPRGTQQRQLTYLNALEAHSPSIKIIYGKFLPNNRRARDIAEVPINISTRGEQAMRAWVKGRLNIKSVKIRKPEEKQTDVNLACKIVEDAYTEADSFDACCLISKDSDFLYPLAAKRRLKQRTLLITPRTDPKDDSVPREIEEQTYRKDRILQISKELVRSCQLPDRVGKYYKPPEWNYPPHHIK